MMSARSSDHPLANSRDHILRAIADCLLEEDAQQRLAGLDATPLLRDVSTWGKPATVAAALSLLLGKIKDDSSAYHEKDSGVLAVVLGDDPIGHVIAYDGYANFHDNQAYLVLRPDGIEWHRPLTPHERRQCTIESDASDKQLAWEYHCLIPNVWIVVERVLIRRKLMTPSQSDMHKLIRHELWLLEVTTRTDLEKAIAFSILHLRLLSLLRSMGLRFDELLREAYEPDESDKQQP